MNVKEHTVFRTLRSEGTFQSTVNITLFHTHGKGRAQELASCSLSPGCKRMTLSGHLERLLKSPGDAGNVNFDIRSDNFLLLGAIRFECRGGWNVRNPWGLWPRQPVSYWAPVTGLEGRQ